jgi:hypothetical protein
MKKKLSIFFLITFLVSLNAQRLEFRLFNCQTTTLVIVKKGKLFFENNLIKPIKYKTSISKEDIKLLEKEISNINKIKGNEVWLNHCVDDGTDLKFKIIDNDLLIKKVFVGNYMDRRLNQIVLIINKYLKNLKADFITTIPYGIKDEKYIKIEIAEQEACPFKAPQEYKNSMLNNWCEF